MTIFHKRNDDDEYTDQQLIEHLISSECSECVDAGRRLRALLKAVREAEVNHANT